MPLTCKNVWKAINYNLSDKQKVIERKKFSIQTKNKGAVKTSGGRKWKKKHILFFVIVNENNCSVVQKLLASITI